LVIKQDEEIFSKVGKIILLVVLVLILNLLNTSDAIAASNKVMWVMTELKLGQVGKVTVLSNTSNFKDLI